MDLEERVKKIETEMFELKETKKGKLQHLQNTVRTGLLPFLVPINKRLGYNPKTDKYERIEELEKKLQEPIIENLYFGTLENIEKKFMQEISEIKGQFKINRESDRGQINANLEAICWIRKIVLNHHKQKIWFWQLKKEIAELKETDKQHAILASIRIDDLQKQISLCVASESVVNYQLAIKEVSGLKEDLRDLSLRAYNLHQAILTNTPLDKLTIGKSLIKLYDKLEGNSDITVTVSRDDGEKGENSKDVISSKENNLSTPERRKDGSKSADSGGILGGAKKKGNIDLKADEQPSKSCETCDYENNDQDNHPCNDCGVLRLHWKPKEPKICTLQQQEKCTTYNSIFCLSPTITTCMWGETEMEKEPTDDLNINEIREYVKTKGYFLVSAADLEKWNTCLHTIKKDIIKPCQDTISENTMFWLKTVIDDIIHEIKKYYDEKEDGDE